ncbi:hypothetical protein [Nocardia sp. CA-135398]|uniref:hypothetical protein n=1 Tax=Nocardia sp. CA-135398 TaxID=3239977 RepID=UPI003D955E6C
MNEHSNDAVDHPILARDGVTILRRVGGRTDDGVLFDGYEEFHPGDPGYDEMLPVARANREEADEPPERPVDSETLARLLRETGLDAGDFDER